ncbi:MAG: hypothetical protein H6732_07985 [Alphaproteobacteria bacterium]|nr:hypothetical protein [Alphaproteobacteria bacterium]
MRPTPERLVLAVLLTACGPGGLTAPTVTVTPAEPTTVDDLVVTVDLDVPAELGAVTWDYTWLRDGRAVPSLSGDTVPADSTAKGEAWSVRVKAVAGEVESQVGEATVRIANSPPTATVALSVTEAAAGQPLGATATGDDVDGDPVSLSFAWFVGGTRTDLTGDAVPAGLTQRGERWRVEVTPNDGEDAGEPATAEVLVSNGPPVITSVTLEPAVITIERDVVAIVEATDPDGDRVQPSFAWVVDGQPAGTSGVLSQNVLQRGVTVELTVTATDGTLEATPFTVGPITVVNAVPTISSVTLTPANGARSIDTLTCTATGLVDAEDDALQIRYAWVVDGTVLGGQTASTLEGVPANFVKGDSVLCRAAAFDGTDEGPWVDSDPVLIGNSPPEVVSAAVSAASIDDPITLSGVVTSDPDPVDTVTLTYKWFVDGAPAGTGESLAAGTAARGTPVRCELTPTDSAGLAGPVFSTATTSVGNRDPVVTSVSLSPAAPTVTDDIVATSTTDDADGDSVDVVYTWYVDDGVSEVEVGGIVGDTLPGGPGAVFARGDKVRVEATPIDAFSSGVAVPSDAVTVENSVPTLAEVTFSPSTFSRATPTITCVPGGFADADNDLPTYTYRWTIGGVDAGTGPTRPGTAMAKGQSVTCSVTPSDSLTTGTAQAATTLVANAPPTLVALTIGPSSPREIDDISATPVDLADPDPSDAGNLSVRYLWFVDDQEVDGVTGPVLTGADFDRGDTIRVQGFPYDGETEGVPADSTSTVTAVNSPPKVISVSLSPAAPTTTDPIVASYVAEDLDATDTLTPVFQWSINNVPVVGVNTATLPASRTKKNDSIRVTVTVTDGQVPASKTSEPALFVQNAPPSTPVAAIVPPRVSVGARPLFCTLVTQAVDPDPVDVVQYTVSWTRNGQPYGGNPGDAGPLKTALTGDTVPAIDVGPDESWACTIVASDGSRTSSTVVTASSWSGDLDALTSGSGYTCGLTSGGQATCWGLDDLGQASAPTSAVFFRHLDAGPVGVCGLQTAGTISCWGASSLKTGVPPGAYVDVQTGDAFACALSNTGGLGCWGANSDGQTLSPGGTWRALAVGSYHACALGPDGKPFCWGYDDEGQVSDRPNEVLVHMAASTRFTCGLRPDGSLTCWGAALQSAPPSTDRFVDLAAGPQGICGLRADGTAGCWAVQGSSVALSPPAGTYAYVTPGNDHACGVRTDGSITCWGSGTNLQLQPPLITPRILSPGPAHACAIEDDDSVTCWGNKADNRLVVPTDTKADALALGRRHTCALLTSGAIDCWGSNTLGQSVDPVGTSWQSLEAGYDHTCAVDNAGAMSCWGSPADGRTTPPTLAPGVTWRKVSAGARHTCAVDSDFFPHCWGYDGSGQATEPGSTQVFDIAAGDAHTCAVTLGGDLDCWGEDGQDQLDAPGGSFFERVVAGAQHSCALTESGVVQCWGNASEGRLEPPANTTFSDLAAGEFHTCAQRESDGVWMCWGRFRF